MKKITFLLSALFFIVFAWQSNAQFNENFDASTTLPAGWSIINQGGANGWTIYNQGTGAHSGTNIARISYNTDAHDDFLITPAIVVAANTTDRISFFIKSLNSGFLEPYEVRLSTTTNTASSDFSVVLQASEIATSTWGEKQFFLNSYIGQTVYIAIRATGTDRDRLGVDDFVNDGAPNCEQIVVASATVNADCDNSQFSVDVDVASVGDATEITDGTDTWAITGTGVVSVGPFAEGSSVNLTITHSDTACNLSLGDFTYTCPPMNTTCATASLIACGETLTGTSAGSTGTSEGSDCSLGNNGVWFTFKGTGGDITVASTTSFDHEMAYSKGVCGALTNLGCEDGTTGAETFTLALTVLNEDYYVYIAHYASGSTTTGTYSISLTCATPPACTQAIVASSTVINDCDASQFSVEVNITSVGDAVEISNGTMTWPITGTGVVTVGPFAFGASQTLTVVHSDIVCNLALGSFNVAACPPANDDCSGAIALTPGLTFNVNPIVGTNVGATASQVASPTIPAPGCGGYSGGDVWYSVVVPADGNITLETNGNPTGASGDSGAAAYSGTCGALVLIPGACNDDGSDDGAFSKVVISNPALAGQTIYFRVWEYGNNAVLNFQASAYSSTLSIEDVNAITAFSYFPNPVKNTLNLKAQSTIQNISIYNMLGQEVLKTSPNALSSEVDMSILQTGAYFVKVTINDATDTIRVIKQ